MEIEPTLPNMAVLPDSIFIGLGGSDVAETKTKF